MYPPVLTKADFVRRYKAGEFGNHAPTWNTVKELEESGYKGEVHLRNRVAGGATFYNLSVRMAVHLWKGKERGYYCSGMAPHQYNLVQGELQDGNITFTTEVGLPMREALAKRTQHARGIIANILLQQFMCPNSWEWLQVLLYRYPGHVIEFSTFSRNWGTLPNYNTVFWEIRLY